MLIGDEKFFLSVYECVLETTIIFCLCEIYLRNVGGVSIYLSDWSFFCSELKFLQCFGTETLRFNEREQMLRNSRKSAYKLFKCYSNGRQTEVAHLAHGGRKYHKLH